MCFLQAEDIWVLFPYSPTTLSLFMGEFSPLTFMEIIDRAGCCAIVLSRVVVVTTGDLDYVVHLISGSFRVGLVSTNRDLSCLKMILVLSPI